MSPELAGRVSSRGVLCTQLSDWLCAELGWKSELIWALLAFYFTQQFIKQGFSVTEQGERTETDSRADVSIAGSCKKLKTVN